MQLSLYIKPSIMPIAAINMAIYTMYIHSSGNGIKELNKGKWHASGSDHLVCKNDIPLSCGISNSINRPETQRESGQYFLCQ